MKTFLILLAPVFGWAACRFFTSRRATTPRAQSARPMPAARLPASEERQRMAEDGIRDFDAYCAVFVDEVLRLADGRPAGLQGLQSMPDGPLRRAYCDGIAPQVAAAEFYRFYVENTGMDDPLDRHL